MSDYPTPWQRKMMWAALTAFCVVLLILIIGTVIWASANIISFLQPILIPVAIAGILTYLLDPLVAKMSRGTLSRTKAVALLFAIAFFALGGLAAWLIPTISIQSANFARQVPAYTERARDYVVDLIYRFDQTFGFLGGGRAKSASTSFTNWLIGPGPSASPHAQPTASPVPKASDTPPTTESIAPSQPRLTSAERQRIQAYVEKQMPNLQQALPTLMEKFWDILKKSIGGFLGVTGFLLSLILVPIYLFFLLNEKPRIERHWKEYLPLRASPLRDEVAEVLSQINSYVTAYFRGQLLVCLIDGILIGATLTRIWPQFCAGDWGHGGGPYHDPLHRDHNLLGASRSDCRFPMGRLGSPDLGDSNFHRNTKSGRHILRPTNRRELRRVASDDSDRIDLCLGFDHWRSNRSPACRTAYGHRKGAAGTICLGPAFEGKDRGLG